MDVDHSVLNSIDALMAQKQNTNQIILFQNQIHHKIKSDLIDQRKIYNYFSENSISLNSQSLLSL